MQKTRNTIQYQRLTSQRRFGVELEINNTVPKALIREVIADWSDRRIKIAAWAQSKNNNYWHVKQDATCGLIGGGLDIGWEVASFVGQGEDDIDHIGMVAQALDDAGCEVNDNCGLHVHVEVDDFNCHQIGVLLGHYSKFEPTLLSIVPEHRRDNPFCYSFDMQFSPQERRRYWSPVEMWMRLKPKDLSPHDNPYRWRSVNVVNFALGRNNKKWNRKTIEFRLPECSLVDYDVKNWIRLFVNFVDWVKTQTMPDDINSVSLRKSFSYMGLGHEVGRFYILGRELFNTKTWLLRRYIRMTPLYNDFFLHEPKRILNEMWYPERDFT